MLESYIERKTGERLKAWAEKEDILLEYVKVNPEGQAGYPDRMILFDGGILFVEFKQKGEKPTRLQKYRHEVLRAMGFEVRIYDYIAVDEIKEYIRSKTRATKGNRPNLLW